jgi:hypothetical protein
MFSVGDRFTSDRGNGTILSTGYHVVFDDETVELNFPEDQIKVVTLIDL